MNSLVGSNTQRRESSSGRTGLLFPILPILLISATAFAASGSITIKISPKKGVISVDPEHPVVNIAASEWIAIHIEEATDEGDTTTVKEAKPASPPSPSGGKAPTSIDDAKGTPAGGPTKATATGLQKDPGQWLTQLSDIDMVANSGGSDPWTYGSTVILKFARSVPPTTACTLKDKDQNPPQGLVDTVYSNMPAKEKREAQDKNYAAIQAYKACLGPNSRPVAFLDESATGWEIYGARLAVGLKIAATSGTVLESKFKDDYLVPIEVVDKSWALFWSAGFAFLGNRDSRYRLDPIPDDSKNLRLVRLKDEGIPYRLAAFAHYTPISIPALCITAGLGTDVPVTGLAAFAGGSFAVRPLPLTDSGFITIGAAYASHKVLSSDFEGRTTVPAGTTTASLLQSRYDVKLFVGLSFSFFGGQDQFKSVYSGSTSKNSTSTTTGGSSAH